MVESDTSATWLHVGGIVAPLIVGGVISWFMLQFKNIMLQMMRTQDKVKETLVEQQNKVKEELVKEQVKIKEELVASQTEMRRSLDSKHAENQKTLGEHIVEDKVEFKGIKSGMDKQQKTLDKQDTVLADQTKTLAIISAKLDTKT